MQHVVERTPSFISASVWLDDVEQSAVSVSAWRPVGAEDRQAVAGQHRLGAEPAISRSAAAQSPAKRCTFCGLPAFGDGPDEQVAGEQDPRSGHPRPGCVVGLAASVVQLERDVADGELVESGR